MTTDTTQTDTTPDALPFIGGVVLAVPCRVPQNIYKYSWSHFDFLKINGGRTTETNNTQANKGSPLLSEEVSYQITVF